MTLCIPNISFQLNRILIITFRSLNVIINQYERSNGWSYTHKMLHMYLCVHIHYMSIIISNVNNSLLMLCCIDGINYIHTCTLWNRTEKIEFFFLYREVVPLLLMIDHYAKKKKYLSDVLFSSFLNIFYVFNGIKKTLN